jgi:dihydroorotase-like cyclic amidohydrolase
VRILISNGRIVDPASSRDEVGDLAIASGRIVGIGRVADFDADRVIDAQGLVVAPGLVDLAARLREPGHEHEGMLESELQAAAAGGITSLVCPPDTAPPFPCTGGTLLRHPRETKGEDYALTTEAAPAACGPTTNGGGGSCC